MAGHGIAWLLAAWLAGLAITPPLPARAQSIEEQANSSISVIDSVGTGIAYDVLDETLANVFITGRGGDAITVLTGGRRQRLVQVLGVSEGLLLSTSTLLIKARSSSLDLQSGIRFAPNGGSLYLYLAQFN